MNGNPSPPPPLRCILCYYLLFSYSSQDPRAPLMGNSGTKTGNNEGNNFSNDDDDEAVREQLVNNDEDDDDDDDEDNNTLKENGGEGGGGGSEWEPGMEFPALNGFYPVIRVISNLSTTSLKEVSLIECFHSHSTSSNLEC